MHSIVLTVLMMLLMTTGPALAASAATADTLDAALCQAQSRLDRLHKALAPLEARKGRPVVDKDTLASALAAMAEENLLIRDALYEVVHTPWPAEVKRAYIEYFLAPSQASGPGAGPALGLAQRVGTENLAALRRLLETPLLEDTGWPTRAMFGAEADFHAFIIVVQGRGADPQWVAQVIAPRLKALAGREEIHPLGAAWLAAEARPDAATFARQCREAGAPWSRYGAQLEGLTALQALMATLETATQLPPLTPAPCGAERPGKK